MLGNYKIRVNNEAESKEAQELFFELGCKWCDGKRVQFCWMRYLFVDKKGYITINGNDDDHFLSSTQQELTLPQLRDLVVLHRNDVKDATHKYIGGGAAYKTVDDIAYLWTRMGWEYKGVAHDLVTLHKEGEQGLISGADALRALADGKDIEYFTDKWVCCDSKQLVVSWYLDDVYQFRIKPSTVKIEIEIPKPFEPKNNKSAWVLDSATPLGYKSIIHHVGCVHSACWGTEDEIKQVVAALRSALTSK